MHQLRVQCAWRGHPVLGDWLYSPAGEVAPFGPPEAVAAERERDRVIALHARSLTLEHPFRDEALTFAAEPPQYWPAGVAT
jgi:23S rRNA pseudouridine1911/1915/1917 synthase